MSTQYPELFAALAAPFDSGEVKVRSISGRQIHYITARTAANRLDNVLGPEDWWDEYHPSENSVLCKLTIRLPDGTTLTKCDAGGYAGMADQGDDDKSGYSDAFKRAAVKFGVGRYLYRDGVPEFAAAAFGGEVYPRPPDDSAPPEGRAPGPVRGGQAPAHAPLRTSAPPAAREHGHGHDGPPRSGKALFAWALAQEKRLGFPKGKVVKYIQSYGKQQGFPDRMVDYSREQVTDAYERTVRKLHEVAAAPGGREPGSDDHIEGAVAN